MNGAKEYETKIEPHIENLEDIALRKNVQHWCFLYLPGIQTDWRQLGECGATEKMMAVRRSEIWIVPWQAPVQEGRKGLVYPGFLRKEYTDQDLSSKFGWGRVTDEKMKRKFLNDMKQPRVDEDMEAEMTHWWGDRVKEEEIAKSEVVEPVEEVDEDDYEEDSDEEHWRNRYDLRIGRSRPQRFGT